MIQLLILSFLLYATPFTVPFFWWVIVFFPFPFFYFVSQKKMTFFSGTAWGIAFFGIHLYGLKSAISTIANCCLETALFLSYTPGLYLCTITGLIFWTTETYISYFFPQKNRCSMQFLSIWCGSLFLLFIFIQNHALIIFLKKGGYPLINPLIPLVNHDLFTNWLSIIPSSIALLFFFMISLSLYVATQTRLLPSAFLTIFLLFFWIIGALFPPKRNCNQLLNNYAKNMIVVPKTIQPQITPEVTINIISELCRDICDEYPSIFLIIFPESAIYDDFGPYSYIEEWSESYLGRKVHLIFGGFTKDQEWKRNCLYHFYNGISQTMTHKTHALPIIEEQLTIFYWLGMYDKLSSHVTPDKNPPCPLIIDTIYFAPYLCSELLSLATPYDKDNKIPILALCNDRYFPPFLQNIVKNLVKLRSILWQRDIFYASYANPAFFDKSGCSININNRFID